ncbi:large subunit ribosomal protein L1 [Sporothrix brasiliensis 5110]|uniref:Large subunit ribosomal protein L1 n=1 Tax=Sporothrix brasiliensis 5110 TaxID=1398154 RepID=A0A0C2F1N1_9PEZI|nr:large subunit ribosomal protein L1 [Sporothrix brasiliensis 5110]KIH92834.1 large subunit ribosomal protein L1 [Sporothrix brasiliensis 5110]
MASQRQCLAAMAGTALSTTARPRPQMASIPQFLVPAMAIGRLQQQQQTRQASQSKKRDKKAKFKAYRVHDKSKLERFSLCDAMRYLRAVEVGRPPLRICYDLAVKLQTNKDGAVLRDRIRLPFPTSSDFRIAVVCKEGSKVAADARQDGAVAVGEETLFAAIKAGDINFNRLLCHIDSVPALMKAGLGPVLGPRGLMPSTKTKTVTNDVRAQMRDIAGTANYRERQGVVRLAIGQLSFTPQMVAENIKALMAQLRADMRAVERNTVKVVDEVVLSTTNGPGFSLDGSFNSTDDKVTPEMLSTVM